MQHSFSALRTIARWEISRSFSRMRRDVLPAAVLLVLLLVGTTGFAADRGVHLQDGMYRVGTDNPELASVLAADERFVVYIGSGTDLISAPEHYDLIILGSRASVPATEKGRAALKAIERDYARYETLVYSSQDDLFAAYPLWLDLQYVKSELDFTATADGRTAGAGTSGGTAPDPEMPVAEITPPSPTLAVSVEELRQELRAGGDPGDQISRYSEIIAPDADAAGIQTPARLSPPLPFDSIILVFVFIFPLYFTSQFFMMSIMNERVGRRGEILLSTPVPPGLIILGKALPYLGVMLAVSAALTLSNGAPLVILLPLFPVILFFLASALVIGMVARSFKELSFISIFFSTVATSYLFFPSIFANVHVISLISPITLIVLALQGDGFGAADYLYSTAVFYLVSIVLFYVGTVNFTEERLFSQAPLLARIRECIGAMIIPGRPFVSLFLLGATSIPFVFMAQLMLLVLLFNLPMPASLLILLVAAAFVEELAKSAGIYTVFSRSPAFFTWKNLVAAAAVVALGFLAGEKLLLFATLAQISESIFGSVLFTSLGALWLPLLLHFAGTLTVAAFVKAGGRRAYLPGLALATLIHSLYNMYFILGWVS
jgi:ABC-type Na+ efflux pump permease subunit